MLHSSVHWIVKHAKKIIWAASIVLLCLAALIYWWYGLTIASTDDAYVGANVVQVAPRVTGQVLHLYVKNDQFVKQGQPLFDLDPATFIVAVNSAKAELAVQQTELYHAQASAIRVLTLVQQDVSSLQEGDDAKAKWQSAQASVQLAEAHLKQAELDLDYTHIVAPVSGWVTKVTVREGDILPANEPVFALISDSEFWVDANFKETQLARIHMGQEVSVETDMYPGHIFKGVVESLSGGSGDAFSLLPPQNATGNWVKIEQRVPVRIHIINTDPNFQLRIGTTATVTVDLRAKKRDKNGH